MQAIQNLSICISENHLFNLHAKFTLIEQLNNINTKDKIILKIRLKPHEDFWIQKRES